MAQNLKMEQKIGIRLSQQQLRFVRLLELNAPELDEAVERELEDNPALAVKEDNFEEESRPLPILYNNSQADNDYTYVQPDENDSIYDNLYEQISEKRLSPIVEQAARYIIASLDTNGYLSRPLNLLVNDMAFGPGLDLSETEVQEAYNAVRSLEPAGIGAADLQDCLEMQLVAISPSQTRDDALRIIREAYEPFTMKHKQRISSLLKLHPQRTQLALDLILSLNPKPGAALGTDPAQSTNIIIPDFIINNDDGELTITLNNRIPELQIEQSFEQALAQLAKTPKNQRKGSEFVVSRFNDARDFIKILTQRQKTMMLVMSAIVKIQKEYFLSEDIYRLRPMIIKNIAEITGLDISVISRATANKFVSTPWGIFPLRFFFSDAVGENDQNENATTNRKIEAEISALVEAEDKRHPLSDQQIMEEMIKRGYEVSRRTVAKYRDKQGIPVARLRKEL